MSLDLEKVAKKSYGLFTVIILLAAVYATIKILIFVSAYNKKSNEQRAIAMCPALLSIGRSSRDTLIVMKSEPLCNEYLLKNFK